MKLYQKVLLGSAGTASAGLVAWKSMFPWIEHDLKIINVGRKLMKIREESMSSLLIDKFEKHVATQPRKVFIEFEDNLYTFEFIDQMACKVANIARARGLGPRDCVAIMIQNEPAFVWTFLGLQKLGVSTAFINFNLKMQPLIHSVKAADPKMLIVGSGESLLESVTEILDDLAGIKVFAQGLGSMPAPPGVESFDPLFLAALPTPVSPIVRSSITMEDICCYIYTSGTTGNPKPVFINHAKAQGIGTALRLVNLNGSDKLYTVLPLYHSAGGGIGFFGAVIPGATMVLKKKFSASQFWSDVRKHEVTVIQYIGELFRYLIAQPPNKLDAVHKVRAAFGNGLRKDIWLEVNKRFQIPEIAEFFGATEGTTLLLNLANKPGAIGRLSPFLSMLDPDPKALVKFDYGTALPIRDKNGRCIKVGIGEPGLFISKVPDILVQNGRFDVYRSSKEANDKKLVRGAFKDGDIYFNYGDVFVLDKEYFLYFQDRIGDTFRWKGENVSTTEVANVVTGASFLEDANVYGVSVPGHDGRAGMAALTLKNGCSLGRQELKELYDHVCGQLPTYARPLFLRHLGEAIITGTFKQKKGDLVGEGYDHNKVSDPLFFLDAQKETYSPLSPSDLGKFLQSRL
ncbi:long-chain fatty acid transport protein 6 [Aplysia californica]|uniref:Long-chain-fatty-acid--CoA ligase n=1 Tax=Aplysia californica TaxID=6500 RepID=A0ABM0KAV9_APLCA|nr:long-chain fatty acid transport protein 6 [Aplysia californica]